MKVFLDNCTSPVLAETLNGYLVHRGESAAHIRDLPISRSASDIEWIRFLAAGGADWLVVTGDGRIGRNRAFRRARLKGLVLAPAYQKTPINQQAAILIWRWPEVETLLEIEAPFLFELPITRSGKIRSLPL